MVRITHPVTVCKVCGRSQEAGEGEVAELPTSAQLHGRRGNGPCATARSWYQQDETP